MNISKFPLLLLRGLIREQHHWGDFPNILQEHFPQTEILMLDIPGNGCFYQSTSPKTIAGMTDALRQQLKDLEKSVPVNLLALSMGGMIAIDWMTRYPEEIATGVLVNTSLANLSPFYQRLRWQRYGLLLKMIRQTPAEKEQTILTLTSNHQQHNADLLKAWQQRQQQYPVTPQNALNQIIASATFQPTQRPSQPLLVVTSKADQLVDYRCSIKLHQAWHTALEQHETAGHDIPLDDPLWLSQIIKDWYAGLRS